MKNSNEQKKSPTSIIAGIMCGVAIVLGVFVKNFDDYRPGWGSRVFFLVVLLFCGALILWKWEENGFRYNWDSIPAPMIVIGSLGLFFLFLLLNLWICKWRLGIQGMGFRPLSTMLVHLIVFGMGIGIHFGSFFVNYSTGEFRSGRWILTALILSAAAAYLLNSIFYTEVGDLGTRMLPTKRCYPGGTCYSVGNEIWGGTGTTFLMGVNLMQGILILNTVSGIYFMIRKFNIKGAPS